MLDEIFSKQQNKCFTLMKLYPEEKGHVKKCPIDMHTGLALSWKKNPENLLTWGELTSLPQAKQVLVPNPSVPFRVGVLLTKDWLGGKELICIDLDHVPDLVAQARQGNITDTSQRGVILKMALEHGFYVEVSQSGEGLHLITLGHKADTKKIRNDLFEYYDRDRWITLTGDAIAYYTGEEVDLEPFEKVMWPNGLPTPTQAPAAVPAVSSAFTQKDIDRLLEKAKKSKNGDKFVALYEGNDVTGDTSSSDMQFTNYLAFWTDRNPAMMDAIFRQSKRMRDKWDKVHSVTGETYGQMTIAKALDFVKEGYKDKTKFTTMADLLAGLASRRKQWDREHTYEDSSGKKRTKPIASQPLEVIKILLDTVTFAIIYTDKTDRSLYYYDYDEGIYSRNEADLEKLILAVAPEITNTKTRQNLLDTILKMPSEIPVVQNFVLTHEKEIAVGNGVLNLETKELKPFSPDFFITSKIDTNYIATASVEPTYNGWSWSQSLKQLSDGDASKEKLLWQVCKAAITGAFWLRQTVLLVDDGRGMTGKSTFEDALIGVVGKSNTAQLRLVEFTDETKLVDALDKRLIVGDDNDAETVISRYDYINPVISSELVRVRNYYHKSESTTLHAFVLQSCNGIPPFKNATEAFFNRLKIIRFTHHHSAGNKDDWMVKNKYIKTQEFREWLLWYVVNRVELGVALVDTQESRQLVADATAESDSIANFIDHWVPQLASTAVPVGWMYDLYTVSCILDGMGKPLPQRRFSREIMNRTQFSSCWVKKAHRPKPEDEFVYKDVKLLVDNYASTKWGELKTWFPISTVTVGDEDSHVTKPVVLEDDFNAKLKAYNGQCFIRK